MHSEFSIGGVYGTPACARALAGVGDNDDAEKIAVSNARTKQGLDGGRGSRPAGSSARCNGTGSARMPANVVASSINIDAAPS